MKDVQTLNLFEPVEDQIRKHEEAKAEQKRMEEERARRLEEMRKNPPKSAKPKKKEVFKGVRHIKVYGNEIFTETNPKVTEEQIRRRLVKEHGFGELSKGITAFELVPNKDKTEAFLVVGPSFKKKG